MKCLILVIGFFALAEFAKSDIVCKFTPCEGLLVDAYQSCRNYNLGEHTRKQIRSDCSVFNRRNECCKLVNPKDCIKTDCVGNAYTDVKICNRFNKRFPTGVKKRCSGTRNIYECCS